MIPVTANSLDALQRGLRLAPDFTRERLLDAMTEATLLLEREVKDAFPSVSGLTRGSITQDAFSTPAGVLGVVGSPSIAAVAVELGTKPHRPPVEPLIAWVREKLGIAGPEARGVAFRIASKIAREGTKAQRPFGKTWERQAAAVAAIFDDVARQVVDKLAADAAGGTA